MVAISLWFCTSSIVSGNEQFRPIVLTLSCDECRRTRVTFARVRVEACDVGTRECIDASCDRNGFDFGTGTSYFSVANCLRNEIGSFS